MQVEVAGLPATSLAALREMPLDNAAWQRVFALRVATAVVASTPPMLGEYMVVDECLVFKPRFPLRPGLTYRATFDPSALPVPPSFTIDRTEQIFGIPVPQPSPPTAVTEIFPTSTVLPENLLRFYLHFSAPMRRGDSYRHIHLLDSAGKPVELPFLELAEELWDDSGQRLTVLLDPGRIKRDLVPHEDVGPPLHSGDEFAIEIGAAWQDADGRPLAKSFRKEFRAAARDDQQPDPQHWKVVRPTAGTRDPLVVALDEPLDNAMLQHAIKVVDAGDTLLKGEIVVDAHETRWSFEPESRWLPGTYQLRIEPTLEDLAGNSPGRPFEVGPTTTRSDHAADCVLSFEIPSPTGPAAP